MTSTGNRRPNREKWIVASDWTHASTNDYDGILFIYVMSETESSYDFDHFQESFSKEEEYRFEVHEVGENRSEIKFQTEYEPQEDSFSRINSS